MILTDKSLKVLWRELFCLSVKVILPDQCWGIWTAQQTKTFWNSYCCIPFVCIDRHLTFGYVSPACFMHVLCLLLKKMNNNKISKFFGKMLTEEKGNHIGNDLWVRVSQANLACDHFSTHICKWSVEFI